jgi:hypothetical protein
MRISLLSFDYQRLAVAFFGCRQNSVSSTNTVKRHYWVIDAPQAQDALEH